MLEMLLIFAKDCDQLVFEGFPVFTFFRIDGLDQACSTVLCENLGQLNFDYVINDNLSSERLAHVL